MHILWRSADKPLISVPCGSSGLWNCSEQAENSRKQSPALITQQALPLSGIKRKKKRENRYKLNPEPRTAQGTQKTEWTQT